MLNNALTLFHYGWSDAIESKYLSNYLLDCVVAVGVFMLKYVLLKKRILPIHMSAVKQSVSIDDVLPKASVNVVGEVIFVVLDVVFVWCNIFLLFWILRLWFNTNIGFILVYFTVKDCWLLPSKLFIQVNKNIRTTYLN